MTVAELRATEPERPPGYDNVIGPRARFGVIAPSTNTTVEADLWAVRPSGVSFHTGRMYIPSPRIASDEDFSALIGQIRASIETAVRDVMTCFPTYMLMGMSAETFWGGCRATATSSIGSPSARDWACRPEPRRVVPLRALRSRTDLGVLAVPTDRG
ncbi:MAG: hypothetical protein R2789_01340 [Microthrixaceae bacterium]